MSSQFSQGFNPQQALDYTNMANAIRFLSADAVQKANSGHPGMPMGMADIAVALWHFHLKHHPQKSNWLNRDRFVLSNGHGSMLLYSLLHLTGYNLSIDDLKQFRQLHSKTAGHPEHGILEGVETTTGPLGQGIANAVGMALAEKLLAQEFNQGDFEIIDYHTYVFLGDGCLMEGISHEACALAGTLNLKKLIVLYDDNNISIDGCVDGWFTDNTPARFESYGWQVIPNIDGHDINAVQTAITIAKTGNKPTLICCKTLIGKGAPNLEGGDKVHGSPLGEAELKATRERLNWPHAPFEIPPAIYANFNAVEKGEQAYASWQQTFHEYTQAYPKHAQELQRRLAKQLPDNWQETVQTYLAKIDEQAQTIATRKASQNSIEAYSVCLPELLGGSADLTSSNLTNWKACKAVKADAWGNHIHYGVREFAMSAMMNGIALTNGHIPFGGTFLTFSDYSRNAIRMAALMKQRSIFVFTHDSIGLGEDGPTHQPIEQVASLRLIPNLDVWRPADTFETAVAWQASIEKTQGPSALILSRQNLPYISYLNTGSIANKQQAVLQGAYVLTDITHDNSSKHVLIMASGSEVALALATAKQLHSKGMSVRVVSAPNITLFAKQSKAIQHLVMGDSQQFVKFAIEAGHGETWYRYGCKHVFALEQFGESAPADVLFKHFGFDEEIISSQIIEILAS